MAAAIAGLVLLVGLGFGVRALLYDAGLADVEGVTVTGAATVPVREILAAADVQLGRPLVAADTSGIAARVAKLPGVASVQVGRSWPHTLTIEIVERVPVATAQTPQGTELVDGSGVVYTGPMRPGLPRLSFGAVGPNDASTVAALAALAALPEQLRAQVLTVDVSVAGEGAGGQVMFGLTENRQVRWGTADRAADKAAVLAPLLTQPGKVYDVTSPDLPTIRR
jgi:cell division protein FtsQ